MWLLEMIGLAARRLMELRWNGDARPVLMPADCSDLIKCDGCGEQAQSTRAGAIDIEVRQTR
jgi:hypothetical protein